MHGNEATGSIVNLLHESRRVLIGVNFFDVTGVSACTACKLANVSSTAIRQLFPMSEFAFVLERDAIARAGYHRIAADTAATTALALLWRRNRDGGRLFDDGHVDRVVREQDFADVAEQDAGCRLVNR